MYAITLTFPPTLKLTPEAYEQLAIANREVPMELTAKGELVIILKIGK